MHSHVILGLCIIVKSYIMTQDNYQPFNFQSLGIIFCRYGGVFNEIRLVVFAVTGSKISSRFHLAL